ncbi:MAG: hypothetical protein J6X83_01405 [Methanomicrobium sp.]|nr:hypothetical protein [Methanomicrobium sp.]
MKQKKTRRGTAILNGATQVKTILSDHKRKNKLHVALLRGTVLGAVLAIFAGILHMDTSIFEGLIIAGTGCAWLGIFYFKNPDDEMFGGAE